MQVLPFSVKIRNFRTHVLTSSVSKRAGKLETVQDLIKLFYVRLLKHSVSLPSHKRDNEPVHKHLNQPAAATEMGHNHYLSHFGGPILMYCT